MTFESKLDLYAGGYAAAAAYRFHRARSVWNGRESVPMSAAAALRLAKADLLSDVARYPSGPGAIGGDAGGVRWVSHFGDFGLRFLGFADELIQLRHNGWFTDTETQESVMRGALFALPGRDGVTRILAGYRNGSDSRKGGWSDDCGEESALIDFGQIYESEAGEDCRDYCDATRSACYAADSMAERAAEEESDYQATWRLGNDAREAVADARTARACARDLLAELRGRAIADMPHACNALRRTIREYLERAREEYDKARKLWRDHSDESAFTEAAGANSWAELVK